MYKWLLKEKSFFYVEAKNIEILWKPCSIYYTISFQVYLYKKKIKKITVYYHVFSKNKLKSFSRKRKKKREKSSIHDSSVYGVALSI